MTEPIPYLGLGAFAITLEASISSWSLTLRAFLYCLASGHWQSVCPNLSGTISFPQNAQKDLLLTLSIMSMGLFSSVDTA